MRVLAFVFSLLTSLVFISSGYSSTECFLLRFLGKSGFATDASGFVQVPNDRISEYLAGIGKNSLEIMYVSTSQLGTGHIALRVEDTVFHMEAAEGLVQDHLHSFVEKFKNHRIEGYVMPTDEVTVQRLRIDLSDPQRYDLYKNNCSQVICRSLRRQKVLNLPTMLSFEPTFVSLVSRFSSRTKIKTVYNSDRTKPLIKRMRNKLLVRAFGLGPYVAYRLKIAGADLSETVARLSFFDFSKRVQFDPSLSLERWLSGSGPSEYLDFIAEISHRCLDRWGTTRLRKILKDADPNLELETNAQILRQLAFILIEKLDAGIQFTQSPRLAALEAALMRELHIK